MKKLYLALVVCMIIGALGCKKASQNPGNFPTDYLKGSVSYHGEFDHLVGSFDYNDPNHGLEIAKDFNGHTFAVEEYASALTKIAGDYFPQDKMSMGFGVKSSTIAEGVYDNDKSYLVYFTLSLQGLADGAPGSSTEKKVFLNQSGAPDNYFKITITKIYTSRRFNIITNIPETINYCDGTFEGRLSDINSAARLIVTNGQFTAARIAY